VQAADVGPETRPGRVRRRVTVPDLLALVVFAVAGFMFAASGHGIVGPQRGDAAGGLSAAITAKQQHSTDLAGQIAQLRDELKAARGSVDPSQQLAAVTAQADQLARSVGLTEVTGPGVTVTLRDATPPDPLPEDMTGDDFVVHQQDIQAVVNSLWRGGAIGVAVMGHRLVSSSAVRCVGNTVILEGRVYSPPFVIEAVGPVQNLLRSLHADDDVAAYRAWAREFGLGYNERTSGQLQLAPYGGPLASTPPGTDTTAAPEPDPAARSAQTDVVEGETESQ
jgi:uncharacterized protein YlxW (UPF0749 family)